MNRINKIEKSRMCWFLVAIFSMAASLAHAQVQPTLTGISPTATSPQVAAVFITGTNLQQAGHATTVTFNGTPVPSSDFLSLTPEQVAVLVPAGATSGPVIVSVGGVNSNALDFQVVSGEYVPDEVIAELAPGAHIGRVIAETGLNLLTVIPLGETTQYHLGITGGESIAEAIRDLFQTGLVADASANFIYEALDLPSKHNQPKPNDPRFIPDQYGPQRIRAVDGKDNTPDAHRLAQGKGVTIAIVDSGINDKHEDLDGKVIMGKNFTVLPGDPNRNNPNDDNSHGTHVAGIAGAITNNNKGIAGVAPASKLLAVKVLGNMGGSVDGIASGIRDAVKKAKVINLSLGGPNDDKKLKGSVDYAIGRKKVVVAAAGNGGRLNGPDTVCYPAGFSDEKKADGLISVGNTQRNDSILLGTRNPGANDNPCNFSKGGSTRNDHVDISAPGTCILSTVPALPGIKKDDGCQAYMPPEVYVEYTGTSMAAPHVSGVAALMLERDPKLTPTQVEYLMRITAVDLGDRGKDPAYGDGRVDAYAAVLAVTSLNKRYELLPRDFNSWKPTGGPRPVPGGGVPPPPPPPGVTPGVGHFDQVLPVTADSRTSFVATDSGKTIRVDPATGAVIPFAGAPESDVVITPDEQYALVSEFARVDVDGELLRIRLSNNATDTLVLQPPVTELTVTPDSSKALVGTVENLSVVDLVTFTQANLKKLDVDVITGISVTPDSQKALVGDIEGVIIVNLNTLALTTVATGIPITGIPITPNGATGVVGVPGGVTIIDIASATPTLLASGTPVSNIALTPDNAKAVYATLGGLVIVDLTANTFSAVVTPVPVTDVDITSDSAKAVVGTIAGVSIVQIATGTATNLVVPTPLQTGISLSPDDKWATIGTPTGVAVIDLTAGNAANVLTSTPVTNVAIMPDSLKGVVGTLTGAAVVDLTAKTAAVIAMSRPLIAPTITPDSQKAVIGTVTGVSVIDIPGAIAPEVSPTPPVLNVLPDDAQPPLNPSGERGKDGSSEG